MIDEIFQKRPKRKIQDLNIVPILDMLVTVIFFLLLSTSFLEFVKLTVPPSATTSVSASSDSEPVTPKMFVTGSQDNLRITLSWSGKGAGQSGASVRASDPLERRKKLIEETARLTKDFSAGHPKERTLQLGLGARVAFQNLISVMDGVRNSMPDIVLISFAEAEARTAAMNTGDQ